MGEGILRSLAGDILDVQSAGSRPAGYVHPLAIESMREIGIDITGHRSKNLEEFFDRPIRSVLTVCGNVDQICPTFPGQFERIHYSFDDPAKADGSPDEILETFRRVRGEIAAFLNEQATRWRESMKAAET